MIHPRTQLDVGSISCRIENIQLLRADLRLHYGLAAEEFGLVEETLELAASQLVEMVDILST